MDGLSRREGRRGESGEESTTKIKKENERLVCCERLASLFFRPKSAPLISHSTKVAKEGDGKKKPEQLESL